MLIRDLFIHIEYKRRWKAAKDLQDIFVRFDRVESCYTQYDVRQNSRWLRRQHEYLHILNIDQFDNDFWKSMLAAHKRELAKLQIFLLVSDSLNYLNNLVTNDV
jgi:hypothetical protein